jgi:NADH-quinone oxidoreductase subunit N
MRSCGWRAKGGGVTLLAHFPLLAQIGSQIGAQTAAHILAATAPDTAQIANQIRSVLPELVMTIGIGGVLAAALAVPRWATQAALFVAVATLMSALTVLFYAQNDQLTAAAFNGLLILDPFAWLLKLIILLFTLLMVAFWWTHRRVGLGEGNGPEFFTLLLTATLGMLLMVSSTNLLTLLLAIETASIPSYLLAGFRKFHKPAAEAALKYVLFGAASAAVMIYGMSVLYGLTGSLDLNTIGAWAQHLPSAVPANLPGSNGGVTMLVVGIAAVLVGVAFKIALVPMQFWCPDVFEGAGVEISTYLSVASKAAGLGLLLRIVVAFTPPAPATPWMAIAVVIIGSITCFWGNLAAFGQTNIKRLLAYSSIAHAGYMTIGLAIAGGRGPTARSAAAEGLLFYLALYTIMNGGAFITAAAIRERIGTWDLREYAGLGRRTPILAATMVTFLLSLTGIPLTVGFAVKIKLFELLFATGHWVGYLGIIVIALNTILGAVYYFGVIRQMYLIAAPDLPDVIELVPTTALALALAIPNIGLFVAYEWVSNGAQSFAQVDAAPVQPTPLTR